MQNDKKEQNNSNNWFTHMIVFWYLSKPLIIVNNSISTSISEDMCHL